VTIIPPATSGEETRKRLTAALSEGGSVILLDNYRTMLDSAELAAALTARVWKDRILGRTEMVTLPIRCAWVCTANNPVLSTEIARRSIRIRIDPVDERPWQRDQFKHPDLAAWATDHRAELIWAVLIMVNEWLALGKPLSKCKRLGSFGNYPIWLRLGIAHSLRLFDPEIHPTIRRRRS
jgi:putative DNA primase/helicase